MTCVTSHKNILSNAVESVSFQMQNYQKWRDSMNSKTVVYILKRLGLALLTVFVVITVTFFIMHAVPGGPFQLAPPAGRGHPCAPPPVPVGRRPGTLCGGGAARPCTH